MKTISFTTAQYVQIDYELASTLFRAVASFIDIIALLIYLSIAGVILGDNVFRMGQDGQAALSVFFIRLPWLLYSPIIEYFTNGRSLGKFIMGIRVVKANGETAGFREYFTRWIFRLIDIWVGGLGFLAMLLSGTTQKRQRLGDMMANTVVIRVQDAQIYSLRDVLAIKNQSNHEPLYPNVIRFSDEDMLLIKSTIIRVNRFPNDENRKFAIELAEKTAQLIGLDEVPKKRMEFLKAVLQDYVVLTR